MTSLEPRNAEEVRRADILDRHLGGKIETRVTFALDSVEALAQAYTPGVAEMCTAIARNPRLAYSHTIKANTIAVVTDGSAVLGLGDIGALAAEPVMSGKAMLFKEFGGLNAFPICLDTRDVDEIVAIVKAIAPVFGGINLEDISAPRCFEVERRLDAELDIPVLHDDQHGTAVVVTAALINALRLTDRTWSELSVVVSGAGAAAVACVGMLKDLGVTRLTAFDRAGAIYAGRPGLNASKAELAARTNAEGFTGTIQQALAGADVFLGVSGPGVVEPRDFASMAPRGIVLALANPIPEVFPEELTSMDVAVVCTGRSDRPNQVNNSLAFPGIFKGALQAGARCVTPAMKRAAAEAIAARVAPEQLLQGTVVPSQLDRTVAPAVARAVARAAVDSGAIRDGW